jgi:hypothetical protein
MKALVTLFAAGAVVAGVLATASPSVAQQPHSWCLRSADSGSLDCNYDTAAQCRASRSGVTSGTCQRNPRRFAPVQPAAAAAVGSPRSWCLRAGDTGNLECAFDSAAQCRAARSGVTSGTCQRNPNRPR